MIGRIKLGNTAWLFTLIKRKASEVTLGIPYNSSIFYWYPYKKIAGSTWRTRKTIDFGSHIKPNNPKYNYKITFIGKLIPLLIVREITK